jgi:hypothetical protein
MATYSVQGSDTLALDLATVKAGTVTTSTAHKVVVQATDGSTLTFRGDFTGGGGSSFPTGGTISGWSTSSASGTANLAGLNLSVAAFNNFLDADNVAGLEAAMFKHSDIFDLKATDGQASVAGHAGDDTFQLGAKFTSDTSILGGKGHDTVVLNGTYGHLEIGATGLQHVEELRVKAGHDYSITTNDANVAAGDTLIVDAAPLKATDGFNFDGTDDRDGSFAFHLGNLANADVAGGLGNDTFFGGGIGGNRLAGGGGNDHFVFGGKFDGSDTVDGGIGSNTVTLNGNFSEGVVFGAAALTNIQTLELHRGHDYNITLDANNLLADTHLTVDAHRLSDASHVRLDASAAAGNLAIRGGAGNDTLIGAQGNNIFIGGHGADSINADGAHNRFTYHAAGSSTGKAHDTIAGFDASSDRFNLDVKVDKIDTAITTGRLSNSHFNADLSAIADSNHLGAHDAVVVTASAGTHAGDTYLVVDMNGHAGYQAGHDLVVELNDATHLGALATTNFI